MVFHSNRMEGLRDLLVEYVKDRPLSPFESETILVQSNGMKHWLTLALADASAFGICAATRLALPSAQLWQIYRTVLGAERLPARMPLDKAPLVWRIMRRLGHWLHDPRFAPLAHYLGEDTQSTRAFGLAQQLADVLDGYQNYRVDWLQQWAKGHDVLDAKRPIPTTQAWQAAMWRDLLADVQAGLPPAHRAFVSRCDVHLAFLQALAAWPENKTIPGLPPRLMVFGITALPMHTLEALAALARFIPVLMFVHNPSQEHWGHLTESLVPVGHPLLASWGKHGRDYIQAVDDFQTKDELGVPLQRVNVFIDPLNEADEAGQAPNALQRLQSAVLHMAEPPTEPIPLAPADDSIRFVQAHSAQREVEVLHDRILSWLDEDTNLHPCDIMVMVPDMASFAPHIHAVFGRFKPLLAEGQGASRHLPYAVVDTTSHADPLVQALQTLLQLPQLRFNLNDWLSLFQVEAMRERFDLSSGDVATLHEWLSHAGVRWGLDDEHRQTWGMSSDLPDANQNTWSFGLQRLLLGYAQGGQSDTPSQWQDRIGQAGIDGLDAAIVAGLLRWLQAMNQSLQQLSQMHTPSEWVQLLQALVQRFFKATDDATQRLLDRLLAPLEDWLSDCQLAGFDSLMALSVVRTHWLAQMDATGLQRRFMGGGVQFATLMPMRAIPFKVVCLLGMNDGAYPRAPAPRDFDLMSQPNLGRAGDRARREDDRYLFLEAVLSARQRLYVSWQGRRASDHAKLPPSVLVGQLMDHLEKCHRLPQQTQPVFQARLQPLQPFSTQYFDADSDFFTYANDWSSARLAPGQTPASPLSPISTASSAQLPKELDNKALKLLLRRPQEVYFLHHLHARLDQPATADPADEPFAPDALTSFHLQQELLHSDTPNNTLKKWRMQGELALGESGHLQQTQMLQVREAMLKSLTPWLDDTDTAHGVQSLTLYADGLTLQLLWGDKPNRWLKRADDSVLHIVLRAGNVMNKKKPRLHTLTDTWVDHLSANAAGHSTTSLLCGSDGVLRLLPLPQEQAQALLRDLAEVYIAAWTKALPLACETACAWLVTQAYAPDNNSPTKTAQQALAAARTSFEGGFSMGELQKSPYLRRAFERFDDVWPDMQPWAERIYLPLLQASSVESVHAAQTFEESQP